MTWRWPSLRAILTGAVQTFRRFPETILISLVCGGFSVAINHFHQELNQELGKTLLVLLMAIPMTYALLTSNEVYGPSAWIRVFGLLAIATFLVVFRMTMNTKPEDVTFYRYAQYQLGFHLLVAFAPFLRRGTGQGFWQYNRYIFLRFLLSGFYSAVIFAGLSVALFALKNLLDLPINDKVWMDVWIAVAFGFNTWFFLAGVPEKWNELDTDTDYPRELRVLIQFILLPLVTLYLLILYAYIGKICVQVAWPKGTIGYLVTGASILGVFSLLLVHPLRDSDVYRWIKVYSRFFYIALFPLVVVLVLAIWKRTSEYGLTEKRYFLFVIAIHLLVIALYFTFSKAKNIKFIPISLCLLTFLTSVGPWGAYSVSLRWQKERLKTLLQSVGGFENGKIKWGTVKADFEQQKELSSILDYIHSTHGLETLNAWSDKSFKDKIPNTVMTDLGLEYIGRWQIPNDEHFNFYLNQAKTTAENISGYDWYMRENLYPYKTMNMDKKPDDRFSLLLSSTSRAILIFEQGRPTQSIDVSTWIDALRKSTLLANEPKTVEEMTVESDYGDRHVKFIFFQISGRRVEVAGKFEEQITNADVVIFLQEKK